MAGNGCSGNWKIIKRYAHEASAEDVKFKILKLLMDSMERSTIPDAGKGEQHRDICEREQG